VSEQFLHDANIGSVFEHVRGAAVTKDVSADDLAGNSRQKSSLSNDEIDPLPGEGSSSSIQEEKGTR